MLVQDSCWHSILEPVFIADLSVVFGEQGWRSGANTRLPPMWPRFGGVDTICGLSLLLVLSLAPRGFSLGTPVFPSPQKPTFPNSNSTRNQVDEEPLCGCATCKSLFIFFYLLYFSLVSQIHFILAQQSPFSM